MYASKPRAFIWSTKCRNGLPVLITQRFPRSRARLTASAASAGIFPSTSVRVPSTSKKILNQIGTQERDYLQLDTFGRMEQGIKVTEKPEILFARINMKEFMEKLEADKAAKEAEAAKAEAMANGIDIEAKPEITFEDFGKLQFQVGEIIACEAVKKSKKLLCSQVKIGSQVRQIVSGIKAHYTPEEMVGKKVMVVTNLKPAKLAGVLSEGMILCAEDADGNLSLMVPEKEMPAGAEIC